MASNTFSCCPLIHLRLRPMKDWPAQRTISATSRGGRLIRPCRLSFSSNRDCIQRTAGGAEMAPGEMQIDRRFFQVAMPQQHLNGAQVGAGFEQMRGKAVAQSMGMDVLVLKTGAFGGLLTGVPENLGGDRMTRRMPSAAGEQPIGGLAP